MQHLPPALHFRFHLSIHLSFHFDELRSARSAHRASFDVAGRALMLVMRLLALGEQEPFENMMIDKIPRQQLVVSVMPGDEKIGIGQIGVSGFHLAMNLHQLVPDWTGAIESGGLETFENSGNTAIAARDHRLEVRFARRFGIELDLP
jgi:hypothetical protein